MVQKTDYAGIASGKNTDKSGLFTAVYGQVPHAPMIAEAPVSMECNLIDTISHGPHDLFIGKIAGVYADENVVRDGTIDLALVKPMLFDMFQRKYWRLGEPFADCWSVGKALEKS
jgi:flavin reductase (DIM6/NTAB) family NADH-FMN oxidoreductase RutF